MSDDSIFGLSPLKSKKKKKPFVTVTPLGGLGQIGMNCMVLGTATSKVVIDCGLMFPSDYHLGIDVIIPKFDFILEHRDELEGIVLTHGHEDHIGALPWLVQHINVPIYGSPFTLALVEHKLRERGLLDSIKLIPVFAEDRVQLGDMTFTFFPVCHSIIDGYALGIETPAGKVIHTGDFKIDKEPIDGSGTDLTQFKKFAGQKGVQLLLSDSTNVEREGSSLSERQVLDSLRSIFAASEGRIVVTLFSSHIQRIQEVFDCARETGRSVAVSGRSLLNNIEMARALGKLRAPDNLYMDSRDMPAMPDDKVILLVTGSQGEPMSALSRIATGGHRDFTLHEGDVVIQSSRLIPGNTVAVNNLINTMYRRGAEVFYDKDCPVHASGHAQRDELTAMFNATRPKFFVPIHGEYRHLVKHIRLAVDCGVEKEHCFIIENGTPFTITRDDFIIEEPVLAEAVLVDGKGVGDVGQAVLKERHLLGGEGLVTVVMVLDKETGEILHGPDISSKGFVFEQQFSHVLEDARELALEVVTNKNFDEVTKAQEAIRVALRRYFRKSLGRDPIVITAVTAV